MWHRRQVPKASYEIGVKSYSQTKLWNWRQVLEVSYEINSRIVSGQILDKTFPSSWYIEPNIRNLPKNTEGITYWKVHHQYLTFQICFRTWWQPLCGNFSNLHLFNSQKPLPFGCINKFIFIILATEKITRFDKAVKVRNPCITILLCLMCSNRNQ